MCAGLLGGFQLDGFCFKYFQSFKMCILDDFICNFNCLTVSNNIFKNLDYLGVVNYLLVVRFSMFLFLASLISVYGVHSLKMNLQKMIAKIH